MSRLVQDRIGVIADDFTGALDAGVEFVHAGLATTLLLQMEDRQQAAVHVINTDSRESDVATAQRRVTDAVNRLQDRRIFKKIDSTLRGHVGPEIEAILASTGTEKAVVCPSVIEAGRTVQDGQLWVNGVLLHESPFRYDPFWPATTSDLRHLLGIPVTHLGLDTVRAGRSVLTQAIADAPTQVVTVDACHHSDLVDIGQAIAAEHWLPCGALGLARAWATALTGSRRPNVVPLIHNDNSPLLVVVASRHPNTITQVHRMIATRGLIAVEITISSMDTYQQQWGTSATALGSGQSVVLRAQQADLPDVGRQRKLLHVLGQLTVRACAEFQLGALLLSGGETASAVCQAVQAQGVDILGELDVGVPWGRLRGGVASDLLVITKAGGFGTSDTLIKIVDTLRRRGNDM